MNHQGNPYRIPKPKKNVLWRGTLRPATEAGKFKGSGLNRYEAVLTPTHLWLWNELAIPLQAVTEITPLNDGGAVRITYLHALLRRDEAVHLCMLNFFSFLDRDKLARAVATINEAWQKASESLPGNGDFRAKVVTLISDAKCETCGNPNAKVLESGYQISFGLLPLFHMERWMPKHPYLCRRHAIMTTFGYNFLTSLVGCLGIPGIITGPFWAWRNALQLKKAFSVNSLVVFLAGLTGIFLPVTAFVVLWEMLKR